MKPNEKYGRLAAEESIQRTVKALKQNNFDVEAPDLISNLIKSFPNP